MRIGSRSLSFSWLGCAYHLGLDCRFAQHETLRDLAIREPAASSTAGGLDAVGLWRRRRRRLESDLLLEGNGIPACRWK